MRYLKSINEFKNVDDNFQDWLSSQFGKPIGKYLGSGKDGYVYEFGKNSVIKISKGNELSSKSIIDKNIKGIAKIFSHGMIEIPNRFIIRGGEHRLNSLKIDDTRTMFLNKNILHYIVMEKLNITTELENEIDDIGYIINSYMVDKYDKGVGRSGLITLFKKIDDEDFIQNIYNYSREFDNINDILYTELIVVLKEVKKYFNWKDIHSGQFGRNNKGELVAFDIDNSLNYTNDFIKHKIREGLSS